MADPCDVSPPVEAHDAIAGAIQGVVKDAATGEPAAGVTIVITGPTGQSETESVGTVIPTISIDSSYTMGIPPSTQSYDAFAGEPEMGVIIDNTPPHRPVIEWSTWARIGVGTESQAPGLLARSTTQPPPRPERHTALEAALGADLTLPIALRGNLRAGAWTEVRTSSGPVGGVELQLQAVPTRLRMFQYSGEGLVSIRAGGNADVVTGAIAYGYLAPWSLWGPWDGASRYMIGVRVVASVTRALDDPRAWTATAGLELEPVGAVRYVLARVTSE